MVPGADADWRALSAARRQALAPLQREWTSMEASQRLKWIELADRLPRLPERERERIQARMVEWAGMTPAERGQARLRYLQAKRAAAGDDRSERWEAYQSLSKDEKDELAAKARASSQAAAAARKSGPTAKAPDPARTIPKSNVVTNPNFVAAPKAVAPTVIQARPGASTTLVSAPPKPPAHQQTGLPKLAASPGFVNPQTLLPQRGPQGAAALTVRSDEDEDEDEPVPRPRPSTRPACGGAWPVSSTKACCCSAS
ncbi:DUF3106 domain-containing protein [Piscinibacter sakaiensis]|uniref:DUF3106 domain-containing protein n=1 Tax=Piscinibacter sakaiensis TaxID=1547922 RepID=UPI003727E44F